MAIGLSEQWEDCKSLLQQGRIMRFDWQELERLIAEYEDELEQLEKQLEEEQNACPRCQRLSESLRY